MRYIIFIIIILLFLNPVLASIHSESSYQKVYCSKIPNSIIEFQNSDYTRVDCLTDTHAIEFDFAKKWAESVGQALYYSHLTGKRAKVVLILENPLKEKIYYNRVKELSKKYDFDVEIVTLNILKIDKNNKCPYITCKCQKK